MILAGVARLARAIGRWGTAPVVAPRWWLPLAALALLATGCLPPQAGYRLGVGTTRITGFMNISGTPGPEGGPIIVVFRNHYTFIDVPGGAGDPGGAGVPGGAGGLGGAGRLHPSVQLETVSPSGAFRIAMPGDVVSMDVYFIAPGYLTDIFRYSRTLGLGDLTYQANLKAMPHWRDHYYTFLSPQLQHLILETRYRLSPGDLSKLSEWLSIQNRRLASRKGAPGENVEEAPAAPPAVDAPAVPRAGESQSPRGLLSPLRSPGEG